VRMRDDPSLESNNSRSMTSAVGSSPCVQVQIFILRITADRIETIIKMTVLRIRDPV
jgi:hypothetical protein